MKISRQNILKKLMKENPHYKCTEPENKYNSMFRIIGEDRAWWDMWCGNLIPSPWHE